MTNPSYTFRRVDDSKVFHLNSTPCHWQPIRADDGETDLVKWYGTDHRGELYVSATRGYAYIKENSNG